MSSDRSSGGDDVVRRARRARSDFSVGVVSIGDAAVVDDARARLTSTVEGEEVELM